MMTLKKIAKYMLIPAIILNGIGIVVMFAGPREGAGVFGAPGLLLLLVVLILFFVDSFVDYVAKKWRK